LNMDVELIFFAGNVRVHRSKSFSADLPSMSTGLEVGEVMLSERKGLVCPLCKGTEFERQEGKMDSRWGVTAHKMTLMICKKCGLIMSFSKGRTIFDFD
jgi:RNase P subunit RPR2